MAKNPAYGRHWICRPMWIDAGIFFFLNNNFERLLVFKALWVGPQVHQSTSWTPPTHGPSTGAVWKNFSFYGSISWSTSAPVHQLNISHVWTIHVCNPKQLIVFMALRVGRRAHQSTSRRPPTRHSCNLEQLLVFRALRVGRRVHQFTSRTPPKRGRFMYSIRNNSSSYFCFY